ncbi:MAG: hypothetical protein ABEJ28_11175, partial [Salinigranum sp.]
MTRWDGVLIGVLVALVVEAVAFLVWGRLTLFGGLVGSGVAGYVAGDELTDGAIPYRGSVRVKDVVDALRRYEEELVADA